LNETAIEKALATPASQSKIEIAVNLKRFDTEFEALLSNMEKRAQLRKK